MSEQDVRGSSTWNVVEDHFRRLQEPALGRPHRLMDPSVSGSGDRIGLTGLVYDQLEGLPRQCAYLVDDGELHPVTAASGSSRQPQLAPNGDSIAFLSDQDEAGRFQLYTLQNDSDNNAQPAPEVPGTVEYCSWSPDGKKVLLGVAGLGADMSGGQGSGTVYQPSEDLPDWMPAVTAGVTEDGWRSLWVYDIATEGLQRVSPAHVNTWEAVWLGTDAVAAVVSGKPDEGAWYTATLVRISLDGEVDDLYRPDTQIGWPAGSADGRRIAVVEAVCSDRWLVAGELMVGTPGRPLERVDTAGIDVSATQWIDDDRLGVLGLRGLETVAAVYDSKAGTLREVWTSTETSCGGRFPEGVWTAAGRLVIVEEGYSTPQRVVVLDSDERDVRADVVHPGTDYMLSVAGTAQSVNWSAPDGLSIEGVLCVPPGEGPFPLVVNIHGGPVWAFRNLWSMYYAWTPLLVARGYAVLNPNPRGSAGRGQDFARLVFGEMGGDDTWDFTAGVDAMVERGIADPNRVGLMGGSYGGFMSAWLATQDQRWAAAIPSSPVTNWYSQHFTSNIPYFDALFLDGNPEEPGDKFHTRSPVAHASKVRTPCLNVAGALDRCTPPTQAQEFHQALLEHGLESALVVYPQEGHGVRAFPALVDYCTRVVDWFDRHMRQKTD